MLAIDVNPIPSYDMLGSPMEAWLGQFLMALTLALHWAFLTMTAGGAAAHVLLRRSSGLEGRRKGMAAFLPFSLTTAMTLGIAPLLFVQVLYGQFFYTSNILIGYVWLGLLVLLIATFYLLYLGWYRLKHGRSTGLIGVLVLGLMAVSAVVLASNATLMQNPDDWQGMRACAGFAPYLSDATLLPRWAFAMCALIAGGGLFVAIFMRLSAKLYNETAGKEVSGALAFSALGLLGMLGTGLWASQSLPTEARETLMGGAEAIFAYAAAGALALALVLTFVVRKASSLGALVLPALVFFVGLLATAFLRDTLRRIALADYFKLSDVTVKSQWESFGLFAVLFVLGLGLIAYIVYLAFGSKPKADPQA
ncbi:MAG: hypothetical protein ACYTFO_02055 [Planctomycetota bacterium]|jgi:hypothetical protein